MDLQFGLVAKSTDHGKTYVNSYVNEDRTYAYAVDYYNSEVVVIAILKQKLIRVVQTIKHTGSSIDPKRQSEAHPCFIDMTPDHRMVVQIWEQMRLFCMILVKKEDFIAMMN